MSTLSVQHFSTPQERLTLSLFIALLVHVVLVFGLGFTFPEPTRRENRPLNIILVQTVSPIAPTESDFLAQANQEGGGEVAEQLTPTTPVVSPFPEITPDIVSASAPPVEAAAPKPAVAEIMHTPAPAKHKVPLKKTEAPVVTNKPESTGTAPHPLPPVESIEAADLMLNARKQIAALQAALDTSIEENAKRPKHTFINASAKESKYANYMEDWRAKVERVGNIHYPDQARREGLSGKLVLDVAINADGTIHEITVQSPSRHPALDEAAIRIARLAAPYAPFPESIRKETDILHVTRTWVFSNNGSLRSF